MHTVAILESREKETLARMLKRAGFDVISAAILKEREVLDSELKLKPVIDACRSKAQSVVVLQTGVGVKRLWRMAERQGVQTDWEALLRQSRVVCRGPKPSAALRAHGMLADDRTEAPHTTKELLAALDPIPIAGAPVFVAHYGERNAELSDYIDSRGGQLIDVLAYRWEITAQLDDVDKLINALIDENISALCITTQVHVRLLRQRAEQRGLTSRLDAAVSKLRALVAVGPTAGAACIGAGYAEARWPTNPKLGPMVRLLSELLD